MRQFIEISNQMELNGEVSNFEDKNLFNTKTFMKVWHVFRSIFSRDTYNGLLDGALYLRRSTEHITQKTQLRKTRLQYRWTT